MDTVRPKTVTRRSAPRRRRACDRDHKPLKSLRSSGRRRSYGHMARFMLSWPAEANESMRAALRTLSSRPGEARKATLLELVTAIGETTEDDQEVVRTVLHLLETGRVRLCGNFRKHPVDDLR